jgi:hypothetical protein
MHIIPQIRLFSDDKIHIFSFPFLEKNNVLLNSVLGHEIGHFYHKSWERDIYTEKEKNYNNILKQYYDDCYKDDLFKAYENTEEGLKILGGFYREVIPDFYGYHLFGPSIIFSLFDISAFETRSILPTASNRYYPMSLPDDTAASIEGRSSWARTGLMVATASYIEPGFKGCITLELSNVSNLPIKLFPGVRMIRQHHRPNIRITTGNMFIR